MKNPHLVKDVGNRKGITKRFLFLRNEVFLSARTNRLGQIQEGLLRVNAINP